MRRRKRRSSGSCRELWSSLFALLPWACYRTELSGSQLALFCHSVLGLQERSTRALCQHRAIMSHQQTKSTNQRQATCFGVRQSNSGYFCCLFINWFKEHSLLETVQCKKYNLWKSMPIFLKFIFKIMFSAPFLVWWSRLSHLRRTSNHHFISVLF